MSKIIESGFVRVAKDHSCEWCSEKINRRENAMHSAVSSEGFIYHFYVHPECHSAMERDEAIDWYEDEPYEPHAQLRGKTTTETESDRIKA